MGQTGATAKLVKGILTAGCLVWAGMAHAQQFTFSNVVVDGNARVPDDTLISLADLTPGRTVGAGAMNDALLRIQNTGLFETVDLVPQGGTLLIRVTEYPTINRVAIEGNRRLDDDALFAVIESEPRRVFTPSQAEADARAIAAAYSDAARLSASVTPRIIRRADNRVDLIFEVGEGGVVSNERVSFVGNREFSDRRLRRVVGTKQAGVLRQLIQADTYNAERIAFDRQVLSDFYNSRGYVDFRVLDVTTEVSRERDATFVTFNVREGQSFDVGRVSLVSEVPGVDPAPYRNELRLTPGETWNPARIERQVARLERLALQQGLDFVRVDPRVTRDDRNLALDVEFALVRGPRIFVERIDIEGNQTTLDRVIRRQFDTVEGDPFNPREIRAAAERIRALGYFSNVDVDTREGSAGDQVIVDVDVDEQPTGSLQLGGTFSDDSGFALVVGFSERNFLGRGQTVGFDISTAEQNETVDLTFVEPAFLGRDLAFSLSAGYRTTDFNDATYQTRVVSVRPGLAFPVGENSRLSVYYEIAEDEIFDVSPDASPILQREEGKELRSAIGYSYSFSTINGGLDPSAGVRLDFGQEFAGLGGDVQYIKTTGRAVAERDVFNEEVTVRAILEGGILSGFSDEAGSRVTDRFFLGSRRLRGFAARGVGPRDTGAGISDVLGGNRYVSARFEADFPLGLPEEYGITGGVFADMASLWDLEDTDGVTTVDDDFELRASVGFSIFWTTPIGPLRMNFSTPIEKNPLDEENTFDVSISTSF